MLCCSAVNVCIAFQENQWLKHSTALGCSVLPLDFYHHVDCSMINVTVLKVIRKLLRVLYVMWFHFVLILYFSIWPRPRPQAPGLGLGLELLSSFNISALPLKYTRGAGAPESPRVPNYCFAVWCVLNCLLMVHYCQINLTEKIY